MESKTLPFCTVDAFTKVPFCGNSAAVYLLPHDLDLPATVMQKIASEMNLSETAFAKLITDEDIFETSRHFELRWFTPTCEVPLCGHATLATSAVIFDDIGNKSESIEFKTVSGSLEVKNLPNQQYEMNFPIYQLNSVIGQYDEVVQTAVGDLPVKDVVLSTTKKLIIRLEDHITREELEKMQVDTTKMMSAAPDIKGVIVTVKGNDSKDDEGKNYDFLSRYFAPWMGISEDPVTGSAHCYLTPYWANVMNKKAFYARQCSSRGGELHLELLKDRVLIRGNAVIVLRGFLNF